MRQFKLRIVQRLFQKWPLIFFGFLVRQMWPPCHIKLDIWKFVQVLAGRSLPTSGLAY